MQLDIERYRPYVDHLDIGEDRKIELIHIVSDIMRGFVDHAFGETSEQILLGTERISHTGGVPLTLDSTNYLKPIFNDAADGIAARGNEL